VVSALRGLPAIFDPTGSADGKKACQNSLGTQAASAPEIELGIILAVLIGWQFVAAEFAGGLIMVALLTVMLWAVMTRQRIAEAKRQADRGLVGRMEGHAAMDMSVGGEGSILARIMSPKGFTAISHYFVMDWASIWIDILGGARPHR
jgi:uncharacterized membrane protein YraQ (UPF0718 family)